jgi:hypothetical protein
VVTTTDRPGTSRWRRAAPTLLLGAAATGVALLLARIDPNTPGSPLPPCPLRALTGLYCPGCGSTRCLHALVHGDVTQALAMNPLLVVVAPVLVLMALRAGDLLPTWRPWESVLAVARQPRAWLWLLLAYGVLRNLPWMPFAWLAPG